MSADEQGNVWQRIEFRNVAELDRLGEFVRAIAEKEGLDHDQQFALDLCLEEAVTNIFMHGAIADPSATPVSLTILAGAPHLTICLEDEGRPFDPTAAAPPPAATSLETAPIGGLGIPLMRKMTSAMSYERKGGRNRLILRFESPGGGESRARAQTDCA
jgi:serine/threonine-protein kinase RsbW